MNIGILAVDSNFPNLALMKISAYHKARGDQVEWYNPLCEYDKVYTAKVFTFTPDYNYYINANQIEKGGTCLLYTSTNSEVKFSCIEGNILMIC